MHMALPCWLWLWEEALSQIASSVLSSFYSSSFDIDVLAASSSNCLIGRQLGSWKVSLYCCHPVHRRNE